MFGDQTPPNILPFGHLVWCCLIVFNRVWSCLIEFEGHQTCDRKLTLFLLFSCLMGDVLFAWTATHQTCLMRACLPRLFSGLYQLFDLCLIKHVLGPGQTGNVWRPNTIEHCLVTKHTNVEVSGQTIKTCLINTDQTIDQSRSPESPRVFWSAPRHGALE